MLFTMAGKSNHLNILTVFLLVTPTLEDPTVHFSQYNVVKNMQFTADSNYSVCASSKCRLSKLACVISCNAETECRSVTYDQVHKLCRMSSTDMFTFGGSSLVFSNTSTYIGLVKESVTDGDWTLVFRAQTHNSMPIWETYTNSAYTSDADMTRLDPSVSSKFSHVTAAHYRSRWLDLWPSANIDQVKLELYVQGKTEVSMTFNGTGSDKTDWFSHSRLVNITPYTDLYKEPPYFSLKGEFVRHFYVSNTLYFSCDQYAWMVVIDDRDNMCQWSDLTGGPFILYSTGNSVNNFGAKDQSGHAEAEVMAIFIKFI